MSADVVKNNTLTLSKNNSDGDRAVLSLSGHRRKVRVSNVGDVGSKRRVVRHEMSNESFDFDLSLLAV